MQKEGSNFVIVRTDFLQHIVYMHLCQPSNVELLLFELFDVVSDSFRQYVRHQQHVSSCVTHVVAPHEHMPSLYEDMLVHKKAALFNAPSHPRC